MKLISSLLVLILSQSAFANVHAKLGKYAWAYYGENFYKALYSNTRFDRRQIGVILNAKHTIQPNNYDAMNSHCGNGCYAHRSVGYENARKIMFGEIYVLKDRRGQHVVDVYCGKSFYFRDARDITSMNSQVNIEHTWPQSKFSHRHNKDLQKSDMHHLFPSDSHANSKRGNFNFGMIDQRLDELDVENCSISQFGRSGREPVFTPPVQHRGNVARALFYFSTHYDLPIDADEEKVLRVWHMADPVDAEELRRHEIIAEYQLVRNPFIDHPDLVPRISDF